MKKFDLLEGQEYIVKKIQEYYDNDFMGEEKWFLISSLSEAEILRKYGNEVEIYKPWIFLTVEQYEVLIEFQRNEKKHRKRGETEYSYSSEEWERGNRRIVSQMDKTFYEKGWGFFQEISGVRELTEKQQRRLFLAKYAGYSAKEIAENENVTAVSVFQSIRRARERLIAARQLMKLSELESKSSKSGEDE